MTWIAVCDPNERRLSLRGLGVDKKATPVLQDSPETRLTRGTLLLEARLPADGRGQVLLGYTRRRPHQRSLMVQLLPGNGVAVVQVHRDAINHVVQRFDPSVRVETIRIAYAWDVARRWAQLSIEIPGALLAVLATGDTPLAMSLADIRDLLLGGAGAVIGNDLIFAALSDKVEPLGPVPGLMPSLPVATPWGDTALASLARGDTVHTRDHGPVPVLAAVTRTVPAFGSFRPIRLRAPYFGLRQDIIVAPDQKILIDGPEVAYLFGQDAALVPARYLVNGYAALEEPCGPTIRYAQLLLPGHGTLWGAGTPLESLNIGRLRRVPHALRRSLFADMDRAVLPEHGSSGYPVLRYHEAIHLARRRAA